MIALDKIAFVLGAKDPEMDMIESILLSLGLRYEYAIIAGERVHPSSAYSATNNVTANSIFIECNVIGNRASIRIDHHNKGDYGFSMGWDQFLEASSIGQLFKFLLTQDTARIADEFELEMSESNSIAGNYEFVNGRWTLTIDGNSFIIPERIVTMAAIDHCSADAYKGLCAGVSMVELLTMRIESLSRELGLEFDNTRTKLNLYLEMLNDNKSQEILDLTSLELGIGYTPDYLILREAAIIISQPVAVITKNNNSCNGKLMLLGLTEVQVEKFLIEKSFNNYILSDVFGVPKRGYAGGMLN